MAFLQGKKILITGGAGFIGSHLSDELLRHGYSVRVLDSLSSQVHGDNAGRPDYLDRDVELMVGHVEDPDAVSAESVLLVGGEVPDLGRQDLALLARRGAQKMVDAAHRFDGDVRPELAGLRVPLPL